METRLAAVYYPAGGGTETAWDPEALISHVVHGEGQDPDLEWTDPRWRQAWPLGKMTCSTTWGCAWCPLGLSAFSFCLMARQGEWLSFLS